MKESGLIVTIVLLSTAWPARSNESLCMDRSYVVMDKNRSRLGQSYCEAWHHKGLAGG